METIGRTEEYHKRMGIDVKKDIDLSNGALNDHRIRVIADELFKFKRCLDSEDACASLEYITNIYVELNSTMLLLGMGDYKEAAFNAVHEANMTKLDDKVRPVIANDGRIAETGNYIAPSMQTVIQTIKKERKQQ